MEDLKKRRPGRPKGGSAIDRSEIAEAALKAIAAGGYSGLSMRGVARAAGVSLATVQRNYPTKDELWEGAVDHYMDGLEEPSLAEPGDPLALMIERFLGFNSTHPGLVTAIFTDRAPGHEERHGYVAGRLSARHERSLALLGDLQDHGVMRRVDGRALLLFLNMGLGAISSAPAATNLIYGFDLEDLAERSRLAAALADILRLGLEAR